MNILDLDPQSFEVYLAESNPSPEQRKFLLDEYQKRRSVLAPAFETVQQAEQELVDEGRRRLNLVPASVPQDMNLIEALRAGEADFAVPGMFMGAGESLMTAADMPYATLTGPTSQETMEQAATELSEYLMLGAAPGVARTAVEGVDPTVVRMPGIGDNGGPPMERPSPRLESGLYSPSLDAIQQINQDRGTYQQLRAQILKAGGKEEELRFAGLDDLYEPNDKVTRQELEDLLAQRVNMIGVEETRATGRTGEGIDSSDYQTMNQAFDEYVQLNLDNEREFVRSEIFPERASEELMSLRDYVSETSMGDTPYLDELTGVSAQELLDQRRTLVNQELSRVGYSSIDEYLEDFPDAQVHPVGGTLYDSVDDAIDRGLFGDPTEEAILMLEDSARRMSDDDLLEAVGYTPGFDPGDTQYSKYMTPGISDYRERRYFFGDPGEVMATPSSPRGLPQTHFDADPTENFLHTRTGFASVNGGTDNAYHVGEIQSDFAQGLRGDFSNKLEETPESRALIRLSSNMLGDMREADWKQLQRMPDDENLVPELRGNVLERLNLNPDRTPELEDFQSAVALAQGAANNALDRASYTLDRKQSTQPQELEDNFARLEEAGMPYGPQEQETVRRLAAERMERDQRDLSTFSSDPQKMRHLLTSTFIPEGVQRRLADRDWLSDEEIDGLFSEGSRVPAAVEVRQTLAQKGFNPDVYGRILQQGNHLERRTYSPQPFIGSTNRWVDFALKNELVNAAKEGKSFFTVSNPEMVRRMTYGSEEGQGEFYGKIVPQRLKNTIKKLDKNIVIAKDPDEARAAQLQGQPVLGPMRLDTADGPETVLGLTLTPDVRRRILGEEGKGLSSFKEGGIVSLTQ